LGAQKLEGKIKKRGGRGGDGGLGERNLALGATKQTLGWGGFWALWGPAA